MRARRFGAAAVQVGSLLVVGLMLAGTHARVARAQEPAASAAPATSSAAPSGSAAPSAGASDAPKAPAREATGYGYSDTAPAKSSAPRAHVVRRAGAPVATLPGFEMLADGGSRLFVQVSKTVDVAERRGTSGAKAKKGKKAAVQAHPTITYVLKGAQVLRRNNRNALVTVHFNTPVVSARLVPSGRDVLFVVDLRADTTPSWKLVPAKEGSAILQIDFAKGDFLPAGAAPPPEPSEQPDQADQGAKDDSN